MHRRQLFGVCLAALATAACDAATKESAQTPGLLPRGTTVTKVKATRQTLTNRVSLTGKVTLNPVFGLEAPADGQVRYVDVTPPTTTPTKPTRVAAVVAKGNKRHNIDVPAGAVFLNRLADDRSTVTAGTPIVSAKHVGYGIVADIDGAQAYKIAGSIGSVQAQIQGGPGPFACSVLGTINALPQQDQQQQQQNDQQAATGMKLVCIPPTGVKMINGAGATLEVVTETAANALVLPVEAVAGTQGKGQVDIVLPDGTRQTREVVLGLTDGRVIEIKSGLTGDEDVAVPGPNLNVPPQGPGGPIPADKFPVPVRSK
ncbi:efflux RND transporter periplasmic adaptor subunit [Allorhizocola rhizosphaerae]|uniref:efflux RND transporter periplasmic adaptor subunit n=1 Tax=Allorhizocola rhizosphaerae TaxID=1872709 RepID=UPI000E3EC34A|nr:efflux RND transporter periplasmic adaptor subunit [Allorhizocola rhizosphaerae]